MSLAEFVSKHVRASEPTDFVVRRDLVQAYTAWRQKRPPVMQMSDLELAERASFNVLPVDSYRTVAEVTTLASGPGQVKDCFVGFFMTWPGGNKTQPTPVVSTDMAGSMTSRAVSAPAGADFGELTAGTAVRELTAGTGVREREVHACFHYRAADGYEPGQLTDYVQNRVAISSPDDLDGLEESLRSAVAGLVESLKTSPARWKVRHVRHEGLVYNVFVDALQPGGPGSTH